MQISVISKYFEKLNSLSLVLYATATCCRHKTKNNEKHQIKLPFIKDVANRICLSADDAGQKGEQHSYLGTSKNAGPALKV